MMLIRFRAIDKITTYTYIPSMYVILQNNKARLLCLITRMSVDKYMMQHIVLVYMELVNTMPVDALAPQAISSHTIDFISQ